MLLNTSHLVLNERAGLPEHVSKSCKRERVPAMVWVGLHVLCNSAAGFWSRLKAVLWVLTCNFWQAQSPTCPRWRAESNRGVICQQVALQAAWGLQLQQPGWELLCAAGFCHPKLPAKVCAVQLGQQLGDFLLLHVRRSPMV